MQILLKKSEISKNSKIKNQFDFKEQNRTDKSYLFYIFVKHNFFI
jgi:hypothetical protein